MIHLLLALLTMPAHAETTRWHQTPEGTEAWVLRADEGITYLDHLTIPAGKIQRLDDRRPYTDAALAKREFDKLTKNYDTRGFSPRPGEVTEVKGDTIWDSTIEWNSDWEAKYTAWVSANVDRHFMEKYNIATDCAEVAVSLRWIFARINGLPAADHLAGTGELFGNESMLADWANLPKGGDWTTDQRFRAALDYILVHIYTHSIMTDFYPVKIDANGIAPGTAMLHLYSEESGHTEIVRFVGVGQPSAIQMIASTVPRQVRELADYGIQDWGYPPVQGRDGLFRFRWPVKTDSGRDLAKPESMPLYSLEQYDPHFSDGFDTFTAALIKKVVPNYTFNSQLFMRASVQELETKLTARKKVVEDGYAICSKTPCAQGTAAWEAWSTPSRDAAIQRQMDQIGDLYSQSICSPGCTYEVDKERNFLITMLDQPYRLDNAFDTWRGKTFSSDPNDTIARRWGH